MGGRSSAIAFFSLSNSKHLNPTSYTPSSKQSEKRSDLFDSCGAEKSEEAAKSDGLDMGAELSEEAAESERAPPIPERSQETPNCRANRSLESLLPSRGLCLVLPPLCLVLPPKKSAGILFFAPTANAELGVSSCAASRALSSLRQHIRQSC